MTLSELFTNIANAIRGKDGTTATITPTDFASRISAIETGVDTSDATATASDMANGVTAYVNGEKVTGNVATFQLDPCHIADSIRQSDPYIVMTKSNNPNQLYRAGTGISVITDKSNFGDATAADVASGKTFTSSAGLKVTGSLSEVTQATPGISVSSSGLITASVTQSGGIVTAGTKSATKQLTTQAAKTVTPGVSSQTAVASGVYTTGVVTVSGDSNLVAGNIKSGVSIFGVSGTLESGYVFKTFSKSQFMTLTVENDVTVIEIFVSDLPSTATILGFWAFIEYNRTGLGYHIFGDFSNDMSSLKWTDTNANYVCRNFSLTHSSDNVLKITCVDRLLYDDLTDRGMLNHSDWRSGGGYVVYSV